MLRTFTIVSVLAALATPAMASSVTVSLIGKSPSVVASDVAKAAAYVCREAVSSPMVPNAKKNCIDATVAATHAKIAKAGAPAATLASR